MKSTLSILILLVSPALAQQSRQQCCIPCCPSTVITTTTLPTLTFSASAGDATATLPILVTPSYVVISQDDLIRLENRLTRLEQKVRRLERDARERRALEKLDIKDPKGGAR
jgi:hypothetical protein